MSTTSRAWSESMRSWGSELGAALDPATVVGPLAPATADAVVETVRRTGFAIVRSDVPTEGSTKEAGSNRRRGTELAGRGVDDVVERRREELLEFGRALGTPVVQSLRRELVEDVKDFSDVEDDDDRGYRSRGELTPHSDPATLILLHCLNPARSGGESRLVSVASIVESMRADGAALVEELFGEFPQWRVAGQYGIAEPGPALAGRPVLTERNGVASCVLYRPFIEMAAAARGRPLTARQVAALDLFERHSTSERLAVRFVLTPGQTLVLHNRSVLHARTDFSDWPELHRRRHLLRMWIDAPQTFPVDPAHELGDFFAPRDTSVTG